MSDIYDELAGTVLGKPAEEVTSAERGAAVQGFWDAFLGVAMLPGNEDLRGTTVSIPPGWEPPVS